MEWGTLIWTLGMHRHMVKQAHTDTHGIHGTSQGAAQLKLFLGYGFSVL